MEIVLLILRLGLAAVFGVSALAKLFDPKGSVKALNDFGVPAVLVRPLVVILPLAELALALSMLFVSTSWYGSIGAKGLLLIFTAGMLYQLSRGRAPDCHCFGQLQNKPVGKTSVVRNIVLITAASCLILQGPGRQGMPLINNDSEVLPFIFGLTVVFMLGAALMFLKQISDQQVQVLRSIEVMEIVAGDGGAVKREEAGLPTEGMPIGAVFPDFALKSVDGRTVTLAVLKAQALPVLFLFISPSCTPCKSLVPEFEKWQTDLGQKVKFVFVSSGKPGDNVEKFGSAIADGILLQRERELADLVKAKWTPTAILMDATGRLASHATAGDTAIKALVEQMRSSDLSREFTYFTNGNGHGSPVKIGIEAPQFKLPDLRGQEVSDAELRGKQTLITFWSLTCPHCIKMMQELKEWDKARSADDPALIVFSDGDKAEHEKLKLASPIVIDRGYKIAAKFGMFGTPSAVLVNEEGKIITETASGAENIWSLIGLRP